MAPLNMQSLNQTKTHNKRLIYWRAISSKIYQLKQRLPKPQNQLRQRHIVQAGGSCYAQGKLSKRWTCFKSLILALPSLLEAGFIQAKSLAVLGKPQETVKILNRLMRTQRFYSVKTALDGDLGRKCKFNQCSNSCVTAQFKKLKVI